MRVSILIAALVATVAAIPTPLKHHAADQELLKKQQDIIYLFDQITQPIPNQQLYNLGLNYNIEQNLVDYAEPHIVKYYYGLVQHGHVQPKGTPFSLSVSQLRKEVALLTRVLLGAKNYNVFLKTAAWARIHVNEHQFIKAVIASLLQHPDTQGVIPPALYEILPQHYFDARVIHEAQNVKILGVDNPLTEQTVVIPVNYTDYLPGGEQQLSYFTQDIGLALYYAYVSLAGYMVPDNFSGYSSHVEGSQHSHIGRGQIYYYLHQQLLAHYNLQRLSHGLGPIDEIDFEHIQTPYHPHLYYTNGLQFAGRSHDIHLSPYYHDLVKNVYVLEKRLSDAIDAGYVITPQQAFLSLYQPHGLNILGELIEGTGKSVNPRYYGSFQAAARQLLGNAPEFSSIWEYTPAPLDVHETSVRDPAFYQLYKRVIKLFHKYQQSLPAYQYDDLVVPGVTIEKVIFPNLVTYFDSQIVSLGNGIVQPVNKVEQENLQVKAEVHRLNHKPYEYQVVVNSEKPISNAVVRVYLAPKYNYDGKPIDINHHRHCFVELDQFVYDLHEGKNVIVRDSHHAPHLSHDYPSVHHISTYIDSAVRSQAPYYVSEPHQIFGFPARLSIPKGQYGGFPVQVLVVVSTPEPTGVQYGPVIPAEWQTYQKPYYQVVDGEQYHEGQGQVQGHVQGYVHHSVDVLPHWHNYGVYGNDAEKLKYYYGHYLYQKYPQQYPIPHVQYYGGEHYPAGTYGYGHQGIHHQQGHQVYGHQYQGQVQYQVPVSHIQQSGVHGIPAVQQGVYQGEGVQGASYQSGVTYPYIVGGVHGVQGVEGVHGVHHGVQGVHHGVQGVHHGVQGVHHGVQGVHHGVHHATEGVEGVQGVEGVHNAYDVNKHNVEYLQKYYQGKHISEVIGGAVSLDHKPLGYPLNRPLAPSAFYVPNIKIADVIVYHHDTPTFY